GYDLPLPASNDHSYGENSDELAGGADQVNYIRSVWRDKSGAGRVIDAIPQRHRRTNATIRDRAPRQIIERAPSLNRHSYLEKSVYLVKRRSLAFRECASQPKAHCLLFSSGARSKPISVAAS